MVDANQFRKKINDAKTCSNVYSVTKLFVIFLYLSYYLIGFPCLESSILMIKIPSNLPICKT